LLQGRRGRGAAGLQGLRRLSILSQLLRAGMYFAEVLVEHLSILSQLLQRELRGAAAPSGRARFQFFPSCCVKSLLDASSSIVLAFQFFPSCCRSCRSSSSPTCS